MIARSLAILASALTLSGCFFVDPNPPGGNVGIGSGRTHFDIGYRYRSAYRMSSKLDFSQVTAGIGYRF